MPLVVPAHLFESALYAVCRVDYIQRATNAQNSPAKMSGMVLESREGESCGDDRLEREGLNMEQRVSTQTQLHLMVLHFV